MTNTVITYAVALLIMLSSFVAQASETHKIVLQGEEYTVVVSNASKQITTKVLSNTKKKLETVLADAQSARYLLSDKGNLIFDVRQGGKTVFVIHYGFSLNAKNKLGGYVGYTPMCVIATDDGDVASVAFDADSPEMEVCMDFMHAVAEDI